MGAKAVRSRDMVTSVEGTIRFADGAECSFMISRDIDQRWGAPTEVLGRAVDPCRAMLDALLQEGVLEDE